MRNSAFTFFAIFLFQSICFATLDDGMSTTKYFNSMTGMAIGNNNWIFTTTNGGMHWTAKTRVNADEFLYNLVCADSAIWFAQGNCLSKNIYCTADMGATWHKIQPDTSEAVVSLCFANRDTGYLVTNHKLFCTFNSGKTWIKKLEIDGLIDKLFLCKNNELYLSSYNGSTGFALFRVSVNTGELENTEFHNPDIYQRGWITDIQYFDDSTGYILTSNNLYKTTDHGKRWTINKSLPVMTSESVNTRLIIFDKDNLFVFGSYPAVVMNNYFLHTSDGGNSWQQILDKECIYDYHFCSKDTCWVFTAHLHPNIFYTTNSGNSWKSLANGVYISSIHFLDSKTATGIINGRIVYTTDGWLTYNTLDSLTSGIANTREKQTCYKLEQNFPNPFNPVTTIRYSIPVAGRVQIIVFDLLGREISLLVNEVKPAGSHCIYFNASGLASGTYFYRIKSGQFTSVRKLILMK